MSRAGVAVAILVVSACGEGARVGAPLGETTELGGPGTVDAGAEPGGPADTPDPGPPDTSGGDTWRDPRDTGAPPNDDADNTERDGSDPGPEEPDGGKPWREQMRADLVDHIWGLEGFPTRSLPVVLNSGIGDPAYEAVPNLGRIDLLDFGMDFGLKSRSYLLHPVEGNGRAVIYHEGHDGNFGKGMATLSWFVAHGYTVMAFSMPLLNPNRGVDIPLPDGTVFPRRTHADFQVLEDAGLPTIRYFVEPVILGVNFLEANYAFESIDMVGLSGGGWTTHVVAALDPRIRNSYPVAGSLPIALRRPRDLGDWEQKADRAIFSIAGYEDLYALAALEPGRRQLQVLNLVDSCCFAATGRVEAIEAYRDDVATELEALKGGSFDVWIDDSSTRHQITDAARQELLDDMETNGSFRDRP